MLDVLEEEIFAETNFRELVFDSENRENFCLAKITRYGVAGIFHRFLISQLSGFCGKFVHKNLFDLYSFVCSFTESCVCETCYCCNSHPKKTVNKF